MNEKTLEKLNKLLELSQNDTVTPKELGNFLVMVLDVIKKSKGEFDKISNENIQVIKDSIDFIEMSHSKILSQVDEQNEKLIQETDSKLKQAQNLFNEIKAMDIKDGENGKDGRDGVDGKDGENGKDGSPDTGEEIIQKINNITGEDDKYKIDAKHIKNLPENTRGGGRGLTKVFTDDTMEGDGTISNPLRVVGGGGTAFVDITGNPTDNTALATALNLKANTADLGDLAFLNQVDTAEIVNHAVTNTKLAQMNANTVKGRLSGNGTPQDIAMADLPISTATQTALNAKWGLTGNAGTNPATDFLGTTDAQPLIFRTNNTERSRIFSNGNLAIGTTTDAGYKVDIAGNFRVNNGSNGMNIENQTQIWAGGSGTNYYNASCGIIFNADNIGVTRIKGSGGIQFDGTPSFTINYPGTFAVNESYNTSSPVFESGITTGGINIFSINHTGVFGRNRLIINNTRASDTGEQLQITGTGRFTASSATGTVLTVRGATSQTGNLQEWQDNASTNLLRVTSGGTLSSFLSTGAKDLINHTRSDGMTVRLRTTNGYDVWLQPGNGGDMKLGDPTGGGASHPITVYGGHMYYNSPFQSTSAIKIIPHLMEKYGDYTQSDFEVQKINHSIGGGTATHPYLSGSIFRGTVVRGYTHVQTITDASTVRIEEPVTAGTNSVLTNTWSLHVVSGASKFGGAVQLQGYTVATLPAGKIGYCAYVTDALAPVALANVVGGGAVTVKVFYNGTNWIVQ